MKAIRIMGMIALFAVGFVSCETTTTTNDNTDNKEENTEEEVVLEIKTEYGPDSSFKMEYQVNAKTDMKHGNYKEYSPTGVLLVERTYKKNKIDGVEKIYFESGKLDGEFAYKDGLHDGPFSYYYEESGKVKQSGSYKVDKVEGVLKSFYPNGTLKEEVMHMGGVTQGPFKEFNENGTLRAEGEYTSKKDQENLEQGLFKEYDEEGELTKKMVCKTGQCCTIWTKEDGDVEPSNELCKAIVAAMEKK